MANDTAIGVGKRFDIVIPILNEEKTLEGQIAKVVGFLSEHLDAKYRTRIVIADNGSTDRSEEIGRHLDERYGRVEYVRVGQRGVGRALKYAWGRSDADFVGYMDLDLATDLKHLDEAFSLLVHGDADLVSGSRLMKGSVVVGRSLKRAVTSRVFNFMLRSFMRARFSDGMCGFKFLRRDVVDGLMRMGAKSDGWFFATELLVCAEHAKLRVVDIPVRWTDDPDSKARIVKLAAEYTRAMIELRKKLKTTPQVLPL